MRRRALFGLFGLIVNVGCAAAAPPASTVILVRHAEKRTDQGKDPELTELGIARAADLERILRDVPLTAVYATEYRRTQATAAPVARAKGLTVKTIRAGDHAAQAKAALAEPGPVLIAGHSNTLGPLIEALGAAAIDPIDAAEYDGLYFVTAVRGRPAQVLLLRYGAPSPAQR
ncbi:MAG: histidine phosphatase family protein [Myxococcota bacterium]